MNVYRGLCWALVLLGATTIAPAQARTAAAPAATVPAVLLSDLHFDPFHDPAKVPQLTAAPIAQWPAILAQPDSPGQAEAFDAMQKTCKAKSLPDSPYALLHSALITAKAEAHGARFVAVSGDLLVHDLDCRYRVAMKLPRDKGDDQSVSAEFAEKTALFVMQQLESTFSGMPVYLTLGNNDSRCNHNRIDVNDPFLATTAPAVIGGLVGVSAAERRQALATYQSAGYYAVTMAPPMQRTRLLVLNDVYMMAKFSTCKADEADRKGADEQMAWLNQQLDAAHRSGQRVWVLAHLPPAINALSSTKAPKADKADKPAKAGKSGKAPKAGKAAKADDFCSAGTVETYLTTGDLAATLIAHADVVRLALFGHTHMDELRLLGTAQAGVPLKIIPSVSPTDGNNPSFTVARIATATATLADFAVYKASNTTGIDTAWPREYAFDETYHEPGFTPKALADLIGKMRLNLNGPDSQAYQTHFMKDSQVSEIKAQWPAYTCALGNSTPETFKACVCNSK